jgi:MFS-type transporter involved in bile tolerance (Atg22 family)
MWSWKSASISALLRASTFFATNLRAGRFDAIRAGLVEAVFAIFAAGIMGAMSQRLRLARPAWSTALFVWLAMPAAMLLAQFGVHRLAGTPHLGTGLIASFCFAAIASSFSWYAMRHGALLGGDAETSLTHDLRHLPRIVLGYILAIPRALLGKQDSRG